MDERQASIVYQNQSHLAFEILKHNSKGEVIDPKDVVELALRLTRVAVNPIPHMDKQKKGDS
jgi:hypothetical protein